MADDVAREMGIDAAEIAERKRFLDFGRDDVERLRAIHGSIADTRRGFADAFYDYLQGYAPLAALLHAAAALTRLKAAHERYFAELTEGSYDWDYVERRLRVGFVHARIGLEPKWYVGAFRKYLADMLPALWDHAGGERDFLPAHGCDAARGYPFGQPLPAAEFRRLLDAPALAANGGARCPA
ncbi:MAG TPA: protoglobin domain-containing protein [Rhodocyclaceae bacterium]|nr:protoglobin domain-containing protein [Rhodocyclaceae bacterium]